MLLDFFKKNDLALSLLFLGMAYCYGVLSPEHYGMYGNDFYLALLVSALASFGAFFGLRAICIERIGLSTLTWLGLTVIILIQPIIHTIWYVDGLVFPFSLLMLSTILSIVAVNIPAPKREAIIRYSAWLLLATGVLSVVTQFVQLFYPNSFGYIISPISKINRLYGNIAQPNTASFINVLAITAGFYLFYLYENHKKIITFLIATFIFLVIGITLTLSRAGLIMLAAAIIASAFYPYQTKKNRLLIPAISVLLSVLSYKLGMWLIQSFSSIYKGSSAVERLMTDGTNLRQILLERAWLAFKSNPIFGVGYDNYYSFSVNNIEKFAWFETADHSHNVIAEIGAEFGLVGLIVILGVIIVLIKQLILFFKSKISPHELFVCLLLLIFVLYSFSEFPLWYPRFLLSFVFFVGLLDKGFALKPVNLKKPLMAIVVVLSFFATLYTGLYNYYLPNYETVMFSKVDNQQKIDAYQDFPNIIGFRKSKEYMLHMVVDVENPDNSEKLIQLGNRLIPAMRGMDIARIQTGLLMKANQQQEADILNRRLCIWEYQQVKNCDYINKQILKLDPDDKMGYAKRLNEWYVQRYGNK